jgi:hypothetical protein
MLQELSAWKEAQLGGDNESIIGNKQVNRRNSNVGEVSVDIDGNSKKAGKRPPSGSSMISGITNPYSNLIDSSRIERLLSCFTLI